MRRQAGGPNSSSVFCVPVKAFGALGEDLERRRKNGKNKLSFASRLEEAEVGPAAEVEAAAEADKRRPRRPRRPRRSGQKKRRQLSQLLPARQFPLFRPIQLVRFIILPVDQASECARLLVFLLRRIQATWFEF